MRIDRSALEELRFRLRGELYEPGAAEYEDTCTLFNSIAMWRPALVARCTAAEDVVAALAFAREHGLKVAVRTGGHSVAGRSHCDDGLVLDLRGIRDVEVDLRRQVARIGAAATRSEVDRATERHGLTCDSLLAATLVTVEGEIVRVQAGSAQLLWTLRGEGDNFNIVVSLELHLQPFLGDPFAS
ncbi:MAG: FAD-dependent oxidoreductase [Actinomycetota bacterium]|nr:FAD-dependent oxidoreductase [Actinomycetota bacterium]